MAAHVTSCWTAPQCHNAQPLASETHDPTPFVAFQVCTASGGEGAAEECKSGKTSLPLQRPPCFQHAEMLRGLTKDTVLSQINVTGTKIADALLEDAISDIYYKSKFHFLDFIGKCFNAAIAQEITLRMIIPIRGQGRGASEPFVLSHSDPPAAIFSTMLDYSPAFLQKAKDIQDCLPCKQCFEDCTTSIPDMPHRRGWCKARRATFTMSAPVVADAPNAFKPRRTASDARRRNPYAVFGQRGRYKRDVAARLCPQTSPAAAFLDPLLPQLRGRLADLWSEGRGFEPRCLPRRKTFSSLAAMGICRHYNIKQVANSCSDKDEKNQSFHSLQPCTWQPLDRTMQQAYHLQMYEMHGLRWDEGNIPYNRVTNVLEEAIMCEYPVFVIGRHPKLAIRNACPIGTNTVDFHEQRSRPDFPLDRLGPGLEPNFPKGRHGERHVCLKLSSLMLKIAALLHYLREMRHTGAHAL
ncbi:hypothetical protein PR048_025811 [Dryococelus australis]|uniref:Uncharacterized protein n=1 Tax=Dryococelus australis TaxID=614101 RepID=A0ABQ9GJM8_9NEOP|nr:hypothetical protein PR048_025811 [Dryococelus australis]